MDTNPYSSPSSSLQAQPRAGTSGHEVADVLIASLAGTKPWLRVVGVFMWLGVAFTLLIGLVMVGSGSVFGEALRKSNPEWGHSMMYGLAVFYLVAGALLIFPARRIWSCGSAIGRLTRSGSIADLQVVLDTQRSFWRFVGIGFLALAGLYAVAFGTMIVAAAMKAASAAP